MISAPARRTLQERHLCERVCFSPEQEQGELARTISRGTSPAQACSCLAASLSVSRCTVCIMILIRRRDGSSYTRVINLPNFERRRPRTLGGKAYGYMMPKSLLRYYPAA